MGSGPARELESDTEPTRKLPGQLASKLDEALAKMDQIDPGFANAREEERIAQLSKHWGRKSKEIIEHFRLINKVLHAQHQISLDVGADGGGRNTRPWVEETSQAFEKLYLRLEEETGWIVAESGNLTLARGTMEEVNFEWLEKLVVVWVVKAIDARSKGVVPSRLS